MRIRSLDLGAGQRDAGVIVTAARAGELRTFHEPGPATEALRLCCDHVDLLGPGWHIVSVSTPRSIFRDLQGTRRRLETKQTTHSSSVRADGSPREFTDDPRSMELRQLAAIGRLDLLKPLARQVYG